MEEAREKVDEQLREIAECPICKSAFSDPRRLPCSHKFCLECLNRTGEAKQRKPGDKMPCPLCRKEFIIPADGMNAFTGAEEMDLRDRMDAHKDLITDRLDPDFGLLDELLANRSLTRSEVAKVMAVSHSYGRSEKLLEYVSDKGIYEKFLDALRNTQQTHLVNFILSNGERLAEVGDDWPLTDREVSILDTNQRSLVDILNTCELLPRLYACKVVNNRQRDFVSSKTVSHEKNHVLLEILRRTSLRNYEKAIYCLISSKQNHIANLFKLGGALVRVRSELETESDVNEVEDEAITKITEILGNHSLGDSARILECTQLRLIAAKRGNSIILYFFCKTSTEFVNLQKMQTSGKLTSVIREMFNEMLSHGQVVNLRTSVYDADYPKSDSEYRRPHIELPMPYWQEVNSAIFCQGTCSSLAALGPARPWVMPGGDSELEDSCEDDVSATSNKVVFGHGKLTGATNKITECSICLRDLTDPRMLPCIHTFCLNCLTRTAEEAQKKPGDKLPCPLCRKEFVIPAHGMNGVQHNFFMENLLEHMTTLQLGTGTINCDMCNIGYYDKTEPIPKATFRCLDCQDNFCDSCTKAHKMFKLSKNHQLVTIRNGTISGYDQRLFVEYCFKHTYKTLDYYCSDCKKIVCVSCFVESHKLHNCMDVTTVDEEFRQTIKMNEIKISQFADQIFSIRKLIKRRTSDFLNVIAETEKKILKRSQELKEMIDRSTKSLLDELSVVRSNQLKKIEIEMEEIDRSCAILKSFEAYCTELRLKGSASDICSSVDQLLARADDLARDHEAIIGRPHQSVEVSFQATDLELLQKLIVNAVGNIHESTTQFENCAIAVGLNDGPIIAKDVVKINLHRPNEITTQEQIPTAMAVEAVAAVYCNTMYVAGIGRNYAEIWKYKMAWGWMKCASLAQGRRRSSAAFINEVMYICGGFEESNSNRRILDKIEAYNAITDKCAVVGKLVHCVQNSGNCVPFKNSFFIFGGLDKDYKPLNHVQVYNTEQNTCTLLSKPLPSPNSWMRATIWDTHVILLGQNTCFLFNFETETWQERKQFKTDAICFGLATENETIFVIGGGVWEEDEHGTVLLKYRDDVRYIPLQNILQDIPIEWKIHATLPRPSLIHSYGKLSFYKSEELHDSTGLLKMEET